MSSFNIDSDASGDEVRSLTMQWNYATSVRKSAEQETNEPLQIPRLVNSFINAVCMIAGIATTLVVIGFATGQIRIENFLQ